MKKIRLMTFLALLSFLIASPKVLAYNATVSYGSGVDIGIKYSQFGNKNTGIYKQRSYTVTYGGKAYEAYCLDPDLSGPKNVTCSPYDADPGMVWLLQQLKGKSSDLKLLAFRMYGIYKDLTKNANGTDKKLSPVKQAIIRYLQVKDGNQEVISAYGNNPSAFLFGNDSLINEAFNLANQARLMSNGLEATTGGSITVGQKTVNGLNATYPLTSMAEIKPEYIDFECENCTILDKQWNGTTGSITVAANECGKEYKLIIVYKSSETSAYMCSNGQINTQTIYMVIEDTEDGEVKIPYPDKLSCEAEDCCTEDPIEPGWIGGNVNNCCEDGGTSEAHEYDLDKLFCKDKDLQVDYYSPKCKTDYYVQEDTGLNEKYCKMYCTERVSVEIPGPITATSGRYFQLTTTSHGTKSPYIEGFKRCRIRVQYDIWEKDYNEVVKKEIDNYNNFQYNSTQHLIYEAAAPNVQDIKGSVNLSVSCETIEYKRDTDTNGDGIINDSDAPQARRTCSKKNSATYNYSYKLYTFPITKKSYHTVKLNETKVNNYSEYELLFNKTIEVTHDKYSTYDLAKEINNANSKLNSLSCGCDTVTSRKRDELPHEGKGYPNEDVPAVRDEWKGKADASNDAYNAAAREAKQLEEDIDKCDNYFTDYEGADAERNYSFDTSMEFSYTQVYMDNDRGLQMDEQYIHFEDEPGCVISGPTPGPDGADNLAGKRYSSIYSKSGNIEKLVDFGEKTLQYEESATGYQKYRDTQYDADKLFTHDAKYHAECSWNEGENIYYTLSPNGLVSEGTDFINFTEHGQEYRLHLSTLDGTYETHWQLIGLGSKDKSSGKGKFDDFFANQGQTCANESPSTTSMLTCKIHVEYEIVLTGYCNGSNGTDTTVNVADCDPYKEGYNLFSFKVVDPANLFPNGYSTDAGEVGYNWSSTDAGQKALKEIQEIGKADMTFHRDYLTYSFELSPTDMGHIKNYNAQANASGGYSDFNMNCNCSGNACINCKSIFVSELANGNVTYDGQGHSVTGWSNQQATLDGIRRKYGW